MNNQFYNPLDENKPIGGLKGLGTAISSVFANIFGNVKAPSPIVQQPFSIGGYSSNLPGGDLKSNPFYQVTATDTGMDSVAGSLGVPLPDLVNANGGMRTLPPVGSYIQTQQPQGQTVSGAQGSLLAGQNPYAPSPTGASTLSQTNYKDARGQSPSALLGVQRDTVNDAFSTFNQTYAATGQADPSLLPTSINLSTIKALEAKGFFASAVDANGQPLSPSQALQSYGYEFKDGKFVQSGTPGAAANKNGQTSGDWSTAKAGAVRDNKFQLVNKGGRLVWINTKRQSLRPVVKKAGPAANAATTVQTVLDTNIGSG